MAGDDQTLIKIAVFGISMSILMTIGLTVMVSGYGSDYDLEEINNYRDELISFSGETMLNQTPWVMTAVYTPWNTTLPVEGHVDPDGWLYGEKITDYDYLGRAADVRLDPEHKSSVPLTVANDLYDYEEATGFKWWIDGGGLLPKLIPVTSNIADILGIDPLQREDRTATLWNYTGYRYVFDPTLPFAVEEGEDPIPSSRDGSLSVVWYSYNGQEGISGALQVYGGDVLLASYAATDIISAYNSQSGYASVYQFNFDGVALNLSIRFDQDAILSGMPLMQAFVTGAWSMAISSLSAGNFFDVENSGAFDMSAGSLIDTFIKVFKFELPGTSSPWVDLVLWILVVLPMSLALAFIALRLMSSVRLFGGGGL